jgi:hypothetical protein
MWQTPNQTIFIKLKKLFAAAVMVLYAVRVRQSLEGAA